MNNTPEIRLGIVTVSRDCFPAALAKERNNRLLEECTKLNLPVTGIGTIVEKEKDAVSVLNEISSKDLNALVIYLGNFGPEGPTTWLAQNFDGPVMFSAAAEESGNDLIHGRGDAFCGMLNTSYNIGLRRLNPYIPEYPVQ